MDTENNSIEIVLNPKRVLIWALGISGILLTLHLITKLSAFLFDLFEFRFLSLGQDLGIGTWVAGALLAATALSFLATTVVERRAGNRWINWAGLAVIFLALSVDEVAALHEWLGDQELLGERDGLLEYQWVVFGLIAVVVVGVLYLPFVWSLERSEQIVLIGAAAFFVGGALVIETFNGLLDSQIFDADGSTKGQELRYDLQTGAEELCEFIGTSIFLYFGLDQLKKRGLTTLRLQPAS